jgi:hypothetical protein
MSETRSVEIRDAFESSAVGPMIGYVQYGWIRPRTIEKSATRIKVERASQANYEHGKVSVEGTCNTLPGEYIVFR